MKKTIYIFSALLLFSTGINAGEFSCVGKISMLMAEHQSCVDDNGKKQFAFKLEGYSSWKCSNSDTASSLLLAAKLSNQSLSVYLNDANGATCHVHSSYLKANYMILY